MPASQGEQLYHAELRKNGWRTLEPAGDVRTQKADLEETINAGPLFEPMPEADAAWQRICQEQSS